MKARHIFWGTLAVSLIVQGALWRSLSFPDQSMWTEHSRHIRELDPRMFDVSVYGHPGAPIVDGVIIAHEVFGVSYEAALPGILALIISLAIAGVCVVSYRLRPQLLWWVAAGGLLMFSPLYLTATPPAAVISPLLVLVFLFAWLLFERASNYPRWWPLALGALLGAAGATRADISGAAALVLLFFLSSRVPKKQLVVIFGAAAGVFTVLNPFMWFMPLQHVIGLINVMQYHYLTYEPHTLAASEALLISPLSVIGILLAVVCVWLLPTNQQIMPRRFAVALMVFTVVFAAVIFTASYQADRYFFPLAFLWETLLPLYLLSLVPKLTISFAANAKAQSAFARVSAWFVIILLVGGQALLLLNVYFLPVPEIFLLTSSGEG